MKWASLVLMNVAMAPMGGILAMYFTGTNFSVSSGVGFLALFGVSVQTGVILVEYINQLRARGYPSLQAAARRRDSALPSDPDDHAGGVARAGSGGDFARDWLGFAASFRDRDRGRTDGGADDEHLPAAGAICVVRAR